MRLGTSKYRTRPLEEALKSYFKDEQIFGGLHETPKSHARKVAVTAACETGEQAVIFTNYNRPEDGQGTLLEKFSMPSLTRNSKLSYGAARRPKQRAQTLGGVCLIYS